MDQGTKTARKTSPKENASFLGKVFFTYSFPILLKGFKRDLEEDDIHEVVNKVKTDKVGDELEKQWLLDKDNKKHTSMFKVILKVYGKRILLYGLIEFILEILLSAVVPLTTAKLVLYFTPGQTELTRNDAYYYAAMSILLQLADCLIYHNYILLVTELGLLSRSAFCSMMYRKCLKLSPTAFSKFNTGKIVTLMTKDVDVIDNFFISCNDCWIAIIQIIVITFLLYNRIGIPAFGGIGIFLLVIPLHLYVGRAVGSMRRGTSKKTDIRLQATQEILSVIKIIKMYTWEKIFAKKISDRRKEEVNKLKCVFYLRALTLSIGHLSAEISFFTLVMLYIYFGENVQADVIYFCVSSFEHLRYTIGGSIPYSITSLAELFTATGRIEELMRAEELSSTTELVQEKVEPTIEMRNVSVNIEDKEILKDVTASFSTGFNIITGPLGSGKSALLKTILRDYPISSGNLKVHGRLSYASQDPWLFPSSIKHNILFGQKYDEERYEKVLRVCALKFDLSILLHGDETIVENSGMNLSKGQQARINLARAIYREADIYLLDDCLAALDTSVQAHIFKECIKEFLKDKICLWVSHNIQSFTEAQKIITLNCGTIKNINKPSDFITTTINEIKDTNKDVIKNKHIEREKSINYTEEEKDTLLKQNVFNNSQENIYHEDKKQGGVDLKVYKRYFRFGGNSLFMCFIIFIFSINQYSLSYSEKLVSTWVNIEENLTRYRNNHSENTSEYSNLASENIYTLKMYGFMLVGGSVLTLASSFIYYYFISNAAVQLHKKMINNVAAATLEFFDNTFIGNILNRFSRDLALIDEYLPFVIMDCFRAIMQVSGVFVVIATVNFSFLMPAAIIFVALILFRKFYIATGRSLKRLESANRSPVIGHLNATLEGLTTIRAYGTQDIVRQEFDRHQDLYASTYHTAQYTERAFGLSLNLLAFTFVTSVTIRFLFLPDTLAGNVGLVLTQALRLSNIIQWGVRQWAYLENQMTSVERVLEYTDVKSEQSSGSEIKNWPSQGLIKYDNVSLTYEKTNETVLRNINIEIQPKEKIGIVGRTGAGKSTIIECLFRLYEICGKITIDGVDIKTVNLQCLRSHLSIIPQDPILFHGTIRSNIDPLQEYPDKEIWRVLEIVKMKHLISDLSLEIVSAESSFSAGQRQLFCLARALIRKNKIIVLDEATANMDPHTDLLINDIIKKEFCDCTVLTIAHKLNNVVKADKIIVMDRGEVVEFDYSNKLLQKKARAPILGYLNSTLEGLSTVRVLEKQNILIKEFDQHQHVFTSVLHMSYTAIRVYCTYMELLCVIFIASVILFFLLNDIGALIGNVSL